MLQSYTKGIPLDTDPNMTANTNLILTYQYLVRQLQCLILNIDVSKIKILTEGDLDVNELYKVDALAKLTLEERAALGVQ